MPDKRAAPGMGTPGPGWRLTPSPAAVIPALFIGLTAGCNDAGFDAPSDADSARQPKRLTTQCSGPGDYKEEDLQLRITGDDETKIILEGEFCPKAPAQLRIVFLVDFSLSMYNAEKNRGNDPLVDGSCGRLKAAEAIVARHFQSLEDKKNTEIKAAVIDFANDARVGITLSELEAFGDKLGPDALCQGTTNTNYKAAFDTAHELLREEPGTKLVYLISDGLPTLGGSADRGNDPAHRKAANEAADSLRGLDKLTFNTVFLGNIHEIEDDSFEPDEFLEDLTGDPSRVKLVERAEDLAKEIVKLDNPPFKLDTDTLEASVVRIDGQTLEVEIASFEAHPSREQVWTFKTKPFEPFAGGIGKAGDGIGKGDLIFEAKDLEGDPYRVTFTIEEGESQSSIPETAAEEP